MGHSICTAYGPPAPHWRNEGHLPKLRLKRVRNSPSTIVRPTRSEVAATMTSARPISCERSAK